MPDFWYIIGSDYEIIVFPSLAAAKSALEKLEDPDRDYYDIRGGWYGKEFSGWIGRDQDVVSFVER